MHMADALLSPSVGITFWASAIGALVFAAKRLKENLEERLIPLMGVLGAFVFAAQMVNFAIPATGSSGHIGGGMLLAILLGPYAAFIVMASILSVQALFFADGGLLALGCNIWNLGFYTCFIAYPLIYKPLTMKMNSKRRILFASVLSVVTGLQLGALSVVIQSFLSGRTELPFGTFLMLMQPIHLAIGLVEGLVTAGIISYIANTRPDIIQSVSSPMQLSLERSLRKILLIFAVLTVITGGILSWFASNNPDGLEWSIEKTYGRAELPEKNNNITATLKRLQEKTAFLPDYSLKMSEEVREKESVSTWVDPGTSLSGIIGAVIVLGFTVVIGFGIRLMRRKRS